MKNEDIIGVNKAKTGTQRINTDWLFILSLNESTAAISVRCD